jgi:hypothetical protein
MAYTLEKLTVARLINAYKGQRSLIIKSNTTSQIYKTTVECNYEPYEEGFNIEFKGVIPPEWECLDTPEEVLKEIREYDKFME